MSDSGDDDETKGGPGEAAFMGLILIVMFLCLFVGWKTPETVVFVCLVLVWNVGMVSTTEALSGFSNPGMLAVGALFVVIKGVEKSQLADKAARKVFGLQTSLPSGLARLMVLCFFLSAFLNNTPVVALLIPITRDWARTRGFSPSIFLIPLSYACIMGGLITVIGTSTNLVVQGLVLDEKEVDDSVEAIGFFEPAYIGVPLGFIGMLYLVIFAPKLLPARGGLFRFVRDRAKDLLTEVEVTSDFLYKGEPVGLVLSRLGLPMDTLIKIRRKFSSGIMRQMSRGLEGSTGHNPATTSAIIQANQRTFKAESMYSYRIKAESLWGTKADLGDAQRPASMAEGLPRKRWVSDTDASNLYNGEETKNMDPAQEPEMANTKDIYPVSAAETIQVGDILFLSCAQTTMIDFQSITVTQKLKGLKFLDVSALDLPGQGTEFFEVVLSDHNHFVGRSPGRDNSEFASYYGCSVVAVRRRGSPDARAMGGPSIIRSSSYLSAGASTSGRAVDSSEAARLEEGVVEPAYSGKGAVIVPATPAMASTSVVGAMPTTPATPVALTRSSRSLGATPLADGSASPRVSSVVMSKRIRSPAQNSRKDRARSGTAEEGVGVEDTQRAFKAGDVILVLAQEEFLEKFSGTKDFFLLTKVGSMPKPVRPFDYLPLVAFLGMLIVVLLGVDMVQAAFAAGAILILGGWVDAKQTVGFVDWALLLLIGSALGLSKGIVNSGLADYVGGAIRDSGISADGSIFVLYFFTVMCTELITNNAAAALATPIAFSIARELEVSYKPLVLTVMLAASSSFITPIGYQTNTLVWGPGGYKFTDFMKIGTPLSMVYLVLGSLLLPRIFPF